MNIGQRYSISVEKEALIFSAAHFITFGENVCESLHGHNYRVRCEIVGELNEHGYVVDFVSLRDSLRRIVVVLDHHVLLPTRHPQIGVQSKSDEVIVTFEERRWVFPDQDCVLLPISNTTAEQLAGHIGQQLLGSMSADELAPLSEITVGVDENEGQWGECRFDLSS